MEVLTLDTHANRLARMKRAVLTSARYLEQDCLREGGRWWCAFVTLTFRDSEAFRKDGLVPFLRRVRAWYLRRGVSFRYVWTAELTKRGRLHYHLIFWLPTGLTLPKPDKRGWWPFGSSRIERARRAVAYLAKYASKGGGLSADYPKGARIHGSGGLSVQSADMKRWWLCPSWVRELWGSHDRPFRAVGGGFVARATGELLASPFVVLGVANGFVRIGRLT